MTSPLTSQKAFVLATALLTLAAAERANAGAYSMDFLIAPYHPGVVDSWFFDINNQGQAAGYIVNWSGNTFQTNAVIYSSGNSQVLASSNTFDFPPSVQGIAINNHGEAIAIINDQPFFFGTSGPAVPINVSGSDVFISTNLLGGLNDSGNTLIGAFPTNFPTLPPGGLSGLALWNVTGSTALTALDPLYPFANPPDPNDFNSGPSTGAYSNKLTRINQNNQFAAAVYVYDFDPMDPANPDDDVFDERFTDAYVYNGHDGYSILQNPVPGEEIRPLNVDESGTVFGWVGSRLALWGLDGALQSFLPDPPEPLDTGIFASYARAQRNDLGQIVAVSLDRGLLFYDPISNAWTDITSSIDGWEPGTRFTTVQGFNDLGQFVGLARPPQGGGDFGYVVSPIPEPSSVALLLAAGWLAIGTNVGRCRRVNLPSKNSAKSVARTARESRR